jgi:superfamily II DNA or RNA helicase
MTPEEKYRLWKEAQQQGQTAADLIVSGRKVYATNEQVLTEYWQQHRQHQKKSIEATRANNNGQIILPTGTGKTRIQVHIHAEDMLNKSKDNKTGVYVIAAHRLLLCTQLMAELREMCLKCKLPINVLYIGSARHDDKDVYDEYFKEGVDSSNYTSEDTTDLDVVRKFYDKTKDQGRHLIIVSTYHSFHRMAAIPRIDICTYDEAHTTIQDNFTENILKVMPNIKRNYFFTATPRVRGEDKGMNDESFYGEVIYSTSPLEMVEAGEILRPKLHLINIAKKNEVIENSDLCMLLKTVQEAYYEHKDRLKKESAFPDKIGAKLLLSLHGSDEIKALQDSLEFKEWCEKYGIKFFAFSSKWGSVEDFETNTSRKKVYENMKNIKDEDDCIFAHIDILTEGIDLPAITGIVLFRFLNKARLLQTLGRGLRLLKEDRINFYKGLIKISTEEPGKYIKPTAYLILPLHFKAINEEGITMKEMLELIFSVYNVQSEEFFPKEDFAALGMEYLDPITDNKTKEKKEKLYPLIHTLIDLEVNELQKELSKQSKEDQYSTLSALLQMLGD